MAVGHRNRLRSKIAESDLLSIPDEELLEFVLFPFIPRKDTAKLAAALLKDFGRLHDVMSATPDELLEYKGMTVNAALFLSLMPEFYARAMAAKHLDLNYCSSPVRFKKYFCSLLAHKINEHFLLVGLDSCGNYIKSKQIAKGSAILVSIHESDVRDFLWSSRAELLVLCHNHPETDAFPSQADISLTRDVTAIAQRLGVRVCDHIIVGVDSVFSFRDAGIMELAILKTIREEQVRSGDVLASPDNSFLTDPPKPDDPPDDAEPQTSDSCASC